MTRVTMKASPSSSWKLSQRAGLLAVLPADLLFRPSHPCSSLGQSHIPALASPLPMAGTDPTMAPCTALGAAEAQRELYQDKWRRDTQEEESKPLLLPTQAVRMEGKKCPFPTALGTTKAVAGGDFIPSSSFSPAWVKVPDSGYWGHPHKYCSDHGMLSCAKLLLWSNHHRGINVGTSCLLPISSWEQCLCADVLLMPHLYCRLLVPSSPWHTTGRLQHPTTPTTTAPIPAQAASWQALRRRPGRCSMLAFAGAACSFCCYLCTEINHVGEQQ